MKPLFKRLLDVTSNYINSENSRKEGRGFSGQNSQSGHSLFKMNNFSYYRKGKNRTSVVGNYKQPRLLNGAENRGEASREEILGYKTGIVKTVQVDVSRNSSERDDISPVEERQRPSSFGDQV